jgi:hypothetical protein
MTFKDFIYATNKEGVESELVKTIFVSLLTSVTLFALLYFVRLKNIEGFMPKYGFFIFFAILSYAFIMPTIRQVRSYKEFPCMSGMMIGMTIGMISGFLPGFFVGATNGMFWGSVFGMFVGITLGVWNGKCCGVMGVMEGVMAGFMGGLMGAMTAVMMINDNLKAAGLIVFLVSAVILVSLSYMIFKETRGAKREIKEDYSFTIFISFILTSLTIWLSVFGPRSTLFQ